MGCITTGTALLFFMSYLNVEIKARCANPDRIREYLLGQGAEIRGTDHQTDTYFNVPAGRLKLREGNIENNLIFYQRPDQAGPKQSAFQLVKVPDAAGLKKALASANGIKVIVEKIREIFFIKNVKFHIDQVPGLGSYIEIEAGNINAPDLDAAQLQAQCDHYLREFGVSHQDLVEVSYSDLLMAKNGISG